MDIEKERLNNGLTTLFIDLPGSTSGSVQIWFRAGSSLEEKKDEGIAHFLEHMFFKGTKNRPGSLIAHEVESFGGEINAFTSFDYTCYYINTPATYIHKTTEILLDMVSNPLFDINELIPERGVVFEEFRRALDNPNQFNFKEIQKTSFTGGYKHQILGTEKTIKNFTREQLINFRKKYYNLSNAMLIVSGDLKNKNKIKNIINAFKLPSGDETKFKPFKLANKPTINIHKKDVRQLVLTLSIDAPKYLSPKSGIEDLAINALSFGEMSPLYKELVTNTSLCSSASASTMYLALGSTHFMRFVFPEKNLDKVTKRIEEVFHKILKNKIQDNEIERIKNQYIASKVYEKENLEAYAFSMGHGFAQNGNINCDEDFLELIKNVKTKEVNDAIEDILKRNIHITLQIPKSMKEEKLKEKLTTFREKLNYLNKSEVKKNLLKFDSTQNDSKVKVFNLKKGIKLIYRENKMTPTFVFHTYLKGGQAHESEKNKGYFQLLSRLITDGYKEMPYEKLKLDLENKSAYMNGFAGKNAYGITLHAQSKDSKELLKHFFGSLFRPLISDSLLTHEKELIFRTFENYKEDPVKECFKLVNQTIFNGHPYAMEILGSEKTIKEVKSQDLINLHQERLKNSEIVFTYCGDEESDVILSILKESIDQLKPREEKKKLKNKISPLAGVHKKVDFKREQTHIFIGRPSYKSGEKEDLYIKMLNAYLSGQSSELFVEVRDKKGLCYAVQPLQHTALEAGYWGIYIGAGSDKTQAAKSAIFEIINKLKNKGLSAKEFNRIKKMIDGQNLLSVQTNDDYANFYSIPVLHAMGLDFQFKSFEMIRKFTHTEFNKFLSKFLEFDWNIIEVGPQT